MCVVGLLVTVPVLLVFVVLIRCNSPGAALFHQQRVGRGRKTFICHKLRTMVMGTPVLGSHEISSSAITGVGRFLRKTKLDELPQLWNVLKGEMSFVGPRPCLLSQLDLIREREDRGVFSVRQGITGLGQGRGIDMSDPAKLAECDAEYVANRSFVFDLRMIWLTIRGAGMGDRVSDTGAASIRSHPDEIIKKDLPEQFSVAPDVGVLLSSRWRSGLLSARLFFAF